MVTVVRLLLPIGWNRRRWVDLTTDLTERNAGRQNATKIPSFVARAHQFLKNIQACKMRRLADKYSLQAIKMWPRVSPQAIKMWPEFREDHWGPALSTRCRQLDCGDTKGRAGLGPLMYVYDVDEMTAGDCGCCCSKLLSSVYESCNW